MSAEVRYVKQDGFIHVAHRNVDVNLCGLAMESADDTAGYEGVEVEPQRVTCPSCLFIIGYVRAIPHIFLPS